MFLITNGPPSFLYVLIYPFLLEDGIDISFVLVNHLFMVLEKFHYCWVVEFRFVVRGELVAELSVLDLLLD